MAVPPRHARADPATLTAGIPLVLRAEAGSCPARNERVVMSVHLDAAGLPRGSAIEAVHEPSGRAIGTIAPFGARPSDRSYNLILPEDAHVAASRGQSRGRRQQPARQDRRT
jgi:hypothetical protein